MVKCPRCGAPNPDGKGTCYHCKGHLGSATSATRGSPGTPSGARQSGAPGQGPATGVYLCVAGQQTGPYSVQQVHSMWSAGRLAQNATYWHAGMANWASIVQLLGSGAASPGQPSPRQYAAPHQAKYDPVSGTFQATMPLMIKLAMSAVQNLGWTIDTVNESVGLVTFQTGISWGSWSGVSCCLNIEEIREYTYRVTGTGRQNPSGEIRLSPDLFGEASGRARRAVQEMQRLAW